MKSLRYIKFTSAIAEEQERERDGPIAPGTRGKEMAHCSRNMQGKEMDPSPQEQARERDGRELFRHGNLLLHLHSTYRGAHRVFEA